MLVVWESVAFENMNVLNSFTIHGTPLKQFGISKRHRTFLYPHVLIFRHPEGGFRGPLWGRRRVQHNEGSSYQKIEVSTCLHL